MLMIRFQRIGRANDPAFRIVVLEKERAAQAGNIVEQLGTYNPRSKALTLKEDRVKHWISMGAQPTDSIHNLLVSKKVIEGKKLNVLPKKTPQVDEEAVAAAAKVADTEAPAEVQAAASVAPVAEANVVDTETPVEAPSEAEVVAEAEPAPQEEVAAEVAVEDVSSEALAKEEAPAEPAA